MIRNFREHSRSLALNPFKVRGRDLYSERGRGVRVCCQLESLLTIVVLLDWIVFEYRCGGG